MSKSFDELIDKFTDNSSARDRMICFRILPGENETPVKLAHPEQIEELFCHVSEFVVYQEAFEFLEQFFYSIFNSWYLLGVKNGIEFTSKNSPNSSAFTEVIPFLENEYNSIETLIEHEIFERHLWPNILAAHEEYEVLNVTTIATHYFIRGWINVVKGHLKLVERFEMFVEASNKGKTSRKK